MVWQQKKGFTLIELLVVISIISLLSSIVLASINSAHLKAQDSKRVQDLLEAQKALELYYSANGKYPATVSTATTRLDCWECSLTLYQSVYDQSKLSSALKQYLDPRPSDPTVPSNGQFTSSFPDTTYGYYYKVSGSGKDYKLAIVGTITDINDAPVNMRDPSFGTWITGANISVYSSAVSKIWTMSTNVSVL
ncbi:MAG: type II secretion system protein [Minisyncoccota bacterium]